jgi:phosphatidylglycerophosphate synthase
MALVALLFAQQELAGTEGEPLATMLTGGLSLIERQTRQVTAAGATRVVVLAERMSLRLTGVLDHIRASKVEVSVARSPAELTPLLSADDDVLFLEEGLVIDQRVLEAAIAHPAPVLAVWPATGQALVNATRIDAQTMFAGVAKVRAERLLALIPSLGEWDLQHTLLRSEAADAGAPRLDLAGLEEYAPGLRRRQPMTWAKPQTPDQATAATEMLIRAAQKGCLDWPARFLHPPLENMMVRRLLPTAVTPNMVTVATAVLGIVVAAAFASGWLWTGLALALIVGPLDGVDGKLARVRFEFSRYGDLEHVLDKLVEYAWYLCLAWHFGVARALGGAWAIAAIIILFALAEAVQGEFFRRFTGRQLDDAGPFERRWRLVSGRRNTFMWTLAAFAAFGHWYAGFAVIAAYTAVNFFVMQFSFFSHLKRFGSQHSEVVDANFRRTAYGFLPATGRSAN